jgi:TP901-1 family phage major tail protein
MTAQSGRLLILQMESATPGTYNTVMGGKTLKTGGSNSQVDVTSKDDSGWKTLGENFGLKSFNISCEGIFKDDASFTAVQTAFLAGTIKNFKVVIPGASTNQELTAAFQISALEVSGNHDAEVSYNLTLDSSGEVTIADAD